MRHVFRGTQRLAPQLGDARLQRLGQLYLGERLSCDHLGARSIDFDLVQQCADELREAIMETHTSQLTELGDRYGQFRRRLETWIVESAEAGEPERYVDPRLRISGLHSGEGLYLRIHADQATSSEAIEAGAREMGVDAITRCLGINPASARGFFENGAFLRPDWLDEVRDETGILRLRVLD